MVRPASPGGKARGRDRPGAVGGGGRGGGHLGTVNPGCPWQGLAPHLPCRDQPPVKISLFASGWASWEGRQECVVGPSAACPSGSSAGLPSRAETQQGQSPRGTPSGTPHGCRPAGECEVQAGHRAGPTRVPGLGSGSSSLPPTEVKKEGANPPLIAQRGTCVSESPATCPR